MRDFDQNYIELAVGYLNEGMLTEAEDVLLGLLQVLHLGQETVN